MMYHSAVRFLTEHLDLVYLLTKKRAIYSERSARLFFGGGAAALVVWSARSASFRSSEHSNRSVNRPDVVARINCIRMVLALPV